MELLFYIFEHIPRCLFHQLTHYYCFGCGGTRAVMEMFQGHFMKSLYYHPFVLYATVVIMIYFSDHLICTITHKGKRLKFHMSFLYIGLAIIIIQFVIKNYLVFRYHFVL